MKEVQIKKDIFWVGAIDWNIRNFHGHTYTTQRGTTYNAYLILDEKITLVDTVYGPFTDELIEKIKVIIPPEKIDYIIANHVETDHTGALSKLLRLCPKAKVFGTAKCKEGLWRNFYLDMDFQVVKTGDKLKLGRRTLNFIEAPMLHWPDSMFTYIIEDQLLLPNDAFGQHYATSERFDDEVDENILMDEAAKYYANILWPLSTLVLKKIEEIQKILPKADSSAAENIPIKMIAPSHGIIWRSSPLKIINAYITWAKNQTQPKVVMVYETMWGATEKIAKAIAQGIIDEGVSLKVFDVTNSDRTQIIRELLDAKGYLFGSSTHDNDMLSVIAGFLHFLKGLKPKNRIAASFGSYGWAGGAVKNIENILIDTGIKIVQEGLEIQYLPNEDDLKRSYNFGKDFAQKIKYIL